MAQRDNNNVIHYSQKELNQIPSFEQRDAGAAGPMGAAGTAAGTVAGAVAGAPGGPAGMVAGGIVGGALGGAAGESAEQLGGQNNNKPQKRLPDA